MPPAPLPRHPAELTAVAPAHGPSSAGFKQVPPSPELRAQIRRACAASTSTWDKLQPLSAYQTESRARGLLAELQLPEAYLGWTMVALASTHWEEQVAAVPYHRRLLLLPHCLRHGDACPADANELGLLCQDCGRCRLTHLRTRAEEKGYKVMIAEGSPVVMQVVLAGHVDAILGVACLDALEKTFEKVLLAGIPCLAVPLLRHGCRNTQVEEDLVERMILTPYQFGAVSARTYVHLMRIAAGLFQADELARLAPRSHATDQPSGGAESAELTAATESLAYDFLAAGGKHARPFVTLAAYDAVTGGRGATAAGAEHAARLPEAVRRVALAIEVFHKASLVHDDIEDDDSFRYGRPTLHRQHGPAVAINVGDYLVGLGYRLVAQAHPAMPADAVAELLGQLAQAHTRLCEGQGAELAWLAAGRPRLAPLDVMKIYALKTAPAFEAALLAGLRLARPVDDCRDLAARYCRHLGVGYQIVNDLDDWTASVQNKCRRAGDVLSGRPTLLWALAQEGLPAAQQRHLETLLHSPAEDGRIEEVRALYVRAGAFGKAAALVDRHRKRAVDAAGQFAEEPLRRLLVFLADATLKTALPAAAFAAHA